MKRKIKVWNKINLYETSVVGIAAYPDAHMGIKPDSFSLIKALKAFVPEAQEIKPVSEPVTIQEIENYNNCKEAKMTEEKEASVEKQVETPVVEKKEDPAEMIAKAIKDAVKEALNNMPVERGLVSTEEKPKVTKSMGELALELGLFKKRE